jgi:hypothetical protein
VLRQEKLGEFLSFSIILISVVKDFMGKSRDSRDRISITFDIGQLRERLKAQAIEPSQSLASIVRMALIEWLEQREAMEDKKSSEEEDRRKGVRREESSPLLTPDSLTPSQENSQKRD